MHEQAPVSGRAASLTTSSQYAGVSCDLSQRISCAFDLDVVWCPAFWSVICFVLHPLPIESLQIPRTLTMTLNMCIDSIWDADKQQTRVLVTVHALHCGTDEHS